MVNPFVHLKLTSSSSATNLVESILDRLNRDNSSSNNDSGKFDLGNFLEDALNEVGDNLLDKVNLDKLLDGIGKAGLFDNLEISDILDGLDQVGLLDNLSVRDLIDRLGDRIDSLDFDNLLDGLDDRYYSLFDKLSLNQFLGVNTSKQLDRLLDRVKDADLLDGAGKILNELGDADLLDRLRLDNIIRGDKGSNAVRGSKGSSLVLGLNGRDQIQGTNRADILNGGAGNDVILGKGGNDILLGLAGQDNLDGGQGDDVLYGGKDRDRLIGGKGRDTFVVQPKLGTDTIQDFNRGQDKIALLGDLSFEDLDITQRGKNAIVSDGKDRLAILTGIQADRLSSSNFISFNSPTSLT